MTWKVVIPSVRLDDFDVTFSYPAWGLALKSVDARGWFLLSPELEDGPIRFEVEKARAAGGGRLRVGADDGGFGVSAPFDEVSISRVAAMANDLVLDVASATTGRAKLSGHARFLDLFGPREREDRRPGMQLEAHWADFSGALLPALREGGVAVPERPDGWGDLRVELAGPYARLSGHAAVQGRDLNARVAIADGRHLSLDARFHGFRTGPLLEPGVRRFIGGRLDGRLAATLDAGRPKAGVAPRAALTDANLRLARRPPGDSTRGQVDERLPDRIFVRAGEHAKAPAPRGPEDAVIRIDGARLANGAARVARFEIAGMGVAIVAAGRAVVAPGAAPPGVEAGPPIAVNIRRARVDFDRLLRQAPVGGRATFTGRLAGDPDRLRLAIDWRQGALRLGRSKIAPVGPVRMRVIEGNTLAIERLHLAFTPAGAAHAAGAVVVDGRIGARRNLDLRIGLRQFELADLLSRSVAGRVDGLLRVRGGLPWPKTEGWLLLSDVGWRDAVLGDGGFKVSSGGDRTFSLEGGFLSGVLTADMAVGLAPSWHARGTFALQDAPIAPLLPRPARRAEPVVSGVVRFDAGAGRPHEVAAALRIGGRAIDGELGLAATMTGTLENPTLDGRLRLDGLEIETTSKSPFPLVRAKGSIRFNQSWLWSEDLHLILRDQSRNFAGHVQLGSSKMPAKVEIASLWPFRVGTIAVRAQGHDLSTSRFIGPLRVADVDLDLTLTRPHASEAVLHGRVRVDRAVIDPSASKAAAVPETPAPRPGWKRWGTKVRLDVLVSGRDAVQVKLPYLPDVELGLACRITGTAAAPKLSGNLEGAGPYSDLALGLYDAFTDTDVRGCYARPGS